jgi:nitroreductase
MTVIETIRNRRSVRKFTDEEISQDDINLLKEAALRSPSSRDNKPWKFYFVKNPELIKGLAESKESGSDLIRNAKLAVVVAANENSSDVWIEDCSIAAIFIQLTAQTLGLGSCWVQIRNRNSHSMT